MPDPIEGKVDEGSSDENENYDPQSVVTGNWKICDLPELPVVTGEQQEDIVLQVKSKVYRWRGQWKQRGIGQLKLLKHQKTGLVRILVRAQKTHKCVINHLLQKKDDILCKLEELKTSSNAWTWVGYDISDNEARGQKFCARFTSKEHFLAFKEEFEKACSQNGAILSAEQKKEEENVKQMTEKEQE